MEQTLKDNPAGGQPPERRPYTGSCHCGATRYVVFLITPPPSLINSEPPPSRGAQRLYRCNCTACHKMGFLHTRPASAFDDFFLLSPSDPFQDLGDYMCNDHRLHFFFCKTCAVRCFTFQGEGETVDVDLAALGMSGTGSEPGKTMTKAWKPKAVDLPPDLMNRASYLSVNGHTIDAWQEGFDLREWVENKSLMYLDWLRDGDEKLPGRYDRPHDCGTY